MKKETSEDTCRREHQRTHEDGNIRGHMRTETSEYSGHARKETQIQNVFNIRKHLHVRLKVIIEAVVVDTVADP